MSAFHRPLTCLPAGLAGVWNGVMGVGVEPGRVFPLVRLVEVLVETVVLLCAAEEGGVAVTAEEEVVCVGAEALREGRMGRE